MSDPARGSPPHTPQTKLDTGRLSPLPSPPPLLRGAFFFLFQRQLDAYQRGDGVKVSFDPGEWSRNACFLADYYSGLGRFPEAGRCLLAAQVTLRSALVDMDAHTNVK